MMKRLITKLMMIVALVPLTMSANVDSFVPQPERVEVTKGKTAFSAGSTIGYATPSLKPAAEYAAKALQQVSGIEFSVKSGKGSITLALGGKNKVKGAYTLNIASGKAAITGADYGGVINGIATLLQMFEPGSVEVENVRITDSPLYDWRGMHIDVSRHFFTVDELKQFIDVLAAYKFNKMHWHLTDDQGWRIEIKRYPLLTEKGAWRTHNNQDQICFARAKAWHNDDLLLPTDRYRQAGEQKEYGGFYTQEQVKDVVAYAGSRGIDVVPEIDMPGHMLAAVSNYNGVACFDETGWGALFSSPVCPGKDSALEFCKNVYEEVFPLFPYEYVHIGGDEVAKENWVKCPDCQARIKEKGLKNEHELQSWFIGEMEQFFNAHGKKMIGWDECIEGGLSATSTIAWWRSWARKAPAEATAHGNKVIVMPNHRFYLDNDEDDADLRNIFNYDFISTSGADASLVIGVQGALWSERIPTLQRLFYQAFPRAFAIAEIAWRKPDGNFDAFARRVAGQMAHLEQLGVNYRIPNYDNFKVVKAFTDKAQLELTGLDKTAVTRYTTDGSVPTLQSPVYTEPITVTENTLFTLRNFHAGGHPGDIRSVRFEKQAYGRSFMPDGNEKAGLVADWYDYGGGLCGEIQQAAYKQQFIVDDVAIPQGAQGNIGLVISGYINLPADDVYTFALLSDDGSTLTIDSRIVVDNDKEHSALQLTSEMALSKGLHPICVKYFDHNGGVLQLTVTNSRGEVLSPKGLYYYY
ncbi:MAG: family 20 glycosylhydrolase [Muribaculaceae bacterium]